jgi:hypothetical protein
MPTARHLAMPSGVGKQLSPEVLRLLSAATSKATVLDGLEGRSAEQCEAKSTLERC